jgi:hypothetical protein
MTSFHAGEMEMSRVAVTEQIAEGWPRVKASAISQLPWEELPDQYGGIALEWLRSGYLESASAGVAD